jgi:hypothetical protein
VRHYLETQQQHLLRAYEPEFLVEAIERAKGAARNAAAASGPISSHFDWAEARGCELGA